MNANRTETTKKTKAAPPKVQASLAAWRERMGYSLREAAENIGCSKQAWINWEQGRQDVPRYIGLAMAALALGMKPYGEIQTDLNNGEC